jgi:hypothetical protein
VKNKSTSVATTKKDLFDDTNLVDLTEAIHIYRINLFDFFSPYGVNLYPQFIPTVSFMFCREYEDRDI